MKKLILLTAMIISPTVSIAEPTTDFANMNCTEAVAWAAAQITSPPPLHFTQKEWNKFMIKGHPETAAISILSVMPGSPCFKSSPEKNPVSGFCR